MNALLNAKERHARNDCKNLTYPPSTGRKIICCASFYFTIRPKPRTTSFVFG
jgi:hypothetical protein